MFAALAADDEAQALARLPRDVEAMRKGELMEYAKTLGVETRRESEDGKKNLWRPVSDVKTDCKEAQARHCQLAGPQARTLAPGAGAASAPRMVDNASAAAEHARADAYRVLETVQERIGAAAEHAGGSLPHEHYL